MIRPDYMRQRAVWLSEFIGNNKMKGVEVGILKGPTFKSLMITCPNLTLTGVDTFIPDIIWKSRKIKDTKELLQIEPGYWYQELLDFCKDYDGRANLIRNFSNQAVNEFEDESLDFVFIDASHDFHSVNEDIYLWKNKVKKGGMVSGHDIDLLQVRMAVSTHNTNFKIGPDNVWWWTK